MIAKIPPRASPALRRDADGGPGPRMLQSVDGGAGAATRMHRDVEVRARELRLRELLLCANGGDGAAYRAFLKEIAGHLRAFLRKRLANLPDEVEDLVQECLLAVHNHRHTYDAAQPLTAWLYAIARYKLVDRLRQRASREARSDPIHDEHAFFAAQDADATSARLDVAKLLARLPDRQRLPIVHMKLEGLSVVETARMTGMSEVAVKVAVHRGLKALAAMVRGRP